MHGIIFQSLKSFVVSQSNNDTWKQIAEATNSPHLHLSVTTYPDTEFIAFCQSASKKLNIDLPELFEKFGIYLMGDLIRIYHDAIRREWDVMDFLLNTECVMHVAAKSMTQVDQLPVPPTLELKRIDNNQISLRYSSPRKLCLLAKGLILGAAKHYKTNLDIIESHCMHRGDSYCEFIIKKTL